MKIKFTKLLNQSSIILSCLIYILPISLILGPAIPNIIISFSSIFFIIISFFLKLKKYYQNNFFKIFIFFWCFIVLNSFVSDNASISLVNSLSYIRYGFFVIAIIFVIDTNKNFFQFFSYIFIPVYLFLLLDTFFQYFFVYNMFGFYTCLDGLSIPQPCTRLSGVFRSEWILGSYIFHFFPIFIILIIFSKYIKAIYKNLLIPLFFVITLFAIYITGERSSFILMIFFSIAYIFVIFFYGKYKKSIIIFSLLLIITFANLIPKNSRFTNNVFFSNYLEKETSTVDVYRSLYITAFNMFLDRPLSGHGNQMFRHKCSDQKYKFGEYYCNNHPHNYYFQILAENGIIGFFFFFIFFLYLVKIFIKSFIFFNIINHQRLTAIFLLSCSLIVSFLPFIPNGNFYTSVTGIFIFTKIGLLYGLKYSKKNSNIG